MYLITENNGFAEEVIGKIAEVLGRAHRMAQTADAPGEERVILNVAHEFAKELTAARADFDHTRFIHEITQHGGHPAPGPQAITARDALLHGERRA